jgi:alkylation response protein AidB-like acyl-CoA dehydrogenase
MDFRLSPAEEAFREDVAAWLRANLPAGWGTPAFRLPEDLPSRVAFARSWQRRLAEGGWAGLHWPRAYGGREASPLEQLLFVEECIRMQAPTLAELGIGASLVGPVLIRHGSDPQRARFLPKILTAEELWCQGFSEPGAGSDLAGIKTRAERDGDAFVVTGQKVWTSYAHFADWCILLARTDPAASRHRGMSLLLVDMRSPGITVRPLIEMTGAPWFNEVFFDGVVVPADRVVGAVHEGWSVAMTTLGHERTVASPPLRLGVEASQVAALAGRAARDPRMRQRLAQATIEARIVRLLAYRQVGAQMRDGRPGPEGSCLKLAWSESDQRLKALALELAGPYGALAQEEPRAAAGGHWQHEFLWSRAASIYAGTSEVQRNVIAERVLGLPRA